MLPSVLLVAALSFVCINHGIGHIRGSRQLSAHASDTGPWRGPMPQWKGPPMDSFRGTSSDDWKGYTILKGGKGYATTPMGQVHYRDIGPRDHPRPIVLLPQTPMSMIQWGAVQNDLAALGVRAVTLDTPGTGLSDLPPHQPTIAEFADNIIPVLDHLRLTKVVIAGHYTGAGIASSFAARYPDRVAGIIMHGPPCFTQEEVSSFQKKGPSNITRTPMPDGSHLSKSVRAAAADGQLSQGLLDGWTWLVISKFLMGPDIGHYASQGYYMAPDLAAITVPGLILSDTEDGLSKWVSEKEACSWRLPCDHCCATRGQQASSTCISCAREIVTLSFVLGGALVVACGSTLCLCRVSECTTRRSALRRRGQTSSSRRFRKEASCNSWWSILAGPGSPRGSFNRCRRFISNNFGYNNFGYTPTHHTVARAYAHLIFALDIRARTIVRALYTHTSTTLDTRARRRDAVARAHSHAYSLAHGIQSLLQCLLAHGIQSRLR